MSAEFESVDIDSSTKTYQPNRITGSKYKKESVKGDVIWCLRVIGTLFDSQYVEFKITGYPKNDSDGKIVGFNVVGCDVISQEVSW